MATIIKTKNLNTLKKYGYPLLAIAVLFLLYYYYSFDPEIDSGIGFFPKCPFYLSTNFHCPGCGSQRAAHDLLHLRIGQALKHNVTIVIVAIVLIGKLYAYISKKYFKEYYYDISRKPKFIYSILALIIVYWIARNLPFYPFTALAP